MNLGRQGGDGSTRILTLDTRDGSVAGEHLYPFDPPESFAEGALRHIALEEAASGVTVNTIALGLISNAAVRETIVDPRASGAGTLASVPIRRFVESE